MSNSLPVSIRTVSCPPSEAEVAQHRSIRLAALYTNPESFLTTYAQERKVDDAQRRERLGQEGVLTFYAKFNEVDHDASHTPKIPWLGTLTLLSPVFLTWFLASSCTTPITTHTVSSRNPSWPLSLLNHGTDL